MRLVELPIEILVRLFEDPTFTTSSLYHLSLSSRRLHFIALPIFFARAKIDYTSGSVVIPMETSGWDILTALQTALFISTMTEITFILPHPSSTSISPFLTHLQRVENFISRFPSVKKITLRLANTGCDCLSVGGDAALRAWASKFGSLLNCILGRQCVALTVWHGSHFTKSYQLHRRAASNSLMRGILSLMKPAPQDKWEFRRASDQRVDSVVVPISKNSSRPPALTSLHIHSPILLLPPCLSWTIDTLRRCPITALTISNISLDAEAWKAVLPLIAAACPNLTAISLMDPENIFDNDLVAFCTRLSRLADIAIGHSSGYSTTDLSSFSIPTSSFRHLTRLKTSPDLLDQFIQHPTSLSNIESISLLCWAFESQHGALGLTEISRMLLAVTRLTRNGRTPTVSLSMRRSYGDLSSDLYSHPLDEDLRASLKCVSGVELTLGSFFFQEPGTVVRWLQLFGCLKNAAIILSDPSDDVSLHTRLILHAMMLTKFMRTVEINGKRYDLASKSGMAL
ncbi:hypothetical protein B0H13DRAFT_2303438 [Mycena leptocephala]|nr:hypothetical protein B0H13DRAFT_2303438 [Mycena leptocephala]